MFGDPVAGVSELVDPPRERDGRIGWPRSAWCPSKPGRGRGPRGGPYAPTMNRRADASLVAPCAPRPSARTRHERDPKSSHKELDRSSKTTPAVRGGVNHVRRVPEEEAERGAEMSNGSRRRPGRRRRWPMVAATFLSVASAIGSAGCGASEESRAGLDGGAAATVGASAISAFAQQAHESHASIAGAVVTHPPQAPQREASPLEAVGRQNLLRRAPVEPAGDELRELPRSPARVLGQPRVERSASRAGSRPGHFARRNTPSVLYMKYVPTFHFALEDDDDVSPSPFGGLCVGRARGLRRRVRAPAAARPRRDEQRRATPRSPASSRDRAVRRRPFAPSSRARLATAVGARWRALGDALQAYLHERRRWRRSRSKYDDYLPRYAPR